MTAQHMGHAPEGPGWECLATFGIISFWFSVSTMFRYGQNSNMIIHILIDAKNIGYRALSTVLDKQHTRRPYV